MDVAFGAHLPSEDVTSRPLVPILLDTTAFEPFAAFPCGSRALPRVLTTYQRSTLRSCFPPRRRWLDELGSRQGGRTQPHQPAASPVEPFLSQNRIEEHLIDLVWHLPSPARRGVLVAGRGFARAGLLQWCPGRQNTPVEPGAR